MHGGRNPYNDPINYTKFAKSSAVTEVAVVLTRSSVASFLTKLRTLNEP